jgi:hypothetical protein
MMRKLRAVLLLGTILLSSGASASPTEDSIHWVTKPVIKGFSLLTRH